MRRYMVLITTDHELRTHNAETGEECLYRPNEVVCLTESLANQYVELGYGSILTAVPLTSTPETGETGGLEPVAEEITEEMTHE